MKAIKGQRVACLGSGPSLTKEDCAAVSEAGYTIVGVNRSWSIAPSCQLVYAGDSAFWQHNNVPNHLPRWTCSENTAARYGLNYRRNPFGRTYCSGALALELVCHFGAEEVILLGYDCSIENGSHWHGEHEKTPNPTAELCRNWLKCFTLVRNWYPETEIVNCSRDSEIECFPRKDLKEVLNAHILRPEGFSERA